MISSIISRLVILVFGTLYPAYASYKAVRTKNVKEYVKWMMYWIVFALFTCAETFTDVFCSFWFPFYYEFKVILVLWLLSPATKGSSILYRKFVHPMLTKREQEIDEYIAKAKEQGYHTVLTLGSKGVNYATTVIMQTAIKGGGGLVNQLRRSYSLSDISADMDALAELNRIKNLPEDELDLGDMPMPIDPRIRRSRGYSPRRSASGSGRVEMYFPEVDVNVRQRGTRPRETGIPLSHIRSNEDVSSGYSSAEMLYAGQTPPTDAQEPLVRTSSVGSSRVTRTKVTRGGAVTKRPAPAEDNLSWSESEDSDPGNQEEYFYDVPSALPSEPVATLPCATLPQPVTSLPTTGGDFKSHIPVALVGEPRKPEIDTKCSGNMQHSTSNLNLSEDASVHSIQEVDAIQILTQPSHAETYKMEEFKSSEVELTTPYDEARVLALIVKENQCSEGVTPSFNDIACFPDVLKSDANSHAQDMDSIPTTFDCEELKIQENLSTNIPPELDAIEFFDTENDFTQHSIVLAETSHVPNVTMECPSVDTDEMQNNKKMAENYTEKAIDEILKDGRAGRYRKHQAPCPPPKPYTESLEITSTEVKGGVNASELASSDRKSTSPRRESSVLKSPQSSPNICKKNQGDDILEGKSDASVIYMLPPIDTFQDNVHLHQPVIPAHAEKLDIKPSGSNCGASKVIASPNQKRKESKTKHDATIMSRFLSKPKSQLASFFPFLSTRGEESRPLSELLTTSLISLNVDSKAQDRARSSSIVGNSQSRSEYNMSVPPELPPRRRTPDPSGASIRETTIKDENTNERGTRMNIREMSHSPPRRHAN